MKYIFTLIYFLIGITTINAQDQQIIDSLKKHNLNESNLEVVVDNDNEISYSFGAISIDSSLFYSNKAINLAEKINYKYGLAIAHSYTARAMLEKDMFKRAIDHFNQSINLFIDLENYPNILDGYRGLAYIYSFGSAQIKSLDYNFKALKIAEQLQDSSSLSTIYNNIGTIYTNLGNYDAAILNYGKTISIDEKNEDYVDLSITYSNVGILKLKNHKLEEATPIYNKILKLLPKIKNPPTIENLYLSLSSYYTERSQFDSAKYYIDLTNKTLEKYPYQHIKAKSFRREAEMLFKQEKYKESINFFDEYLRLSSPIGVNKLFPEIYKKKGEAYSHLKMYQKAYQFAELANNATDTLQHKKIASFLREFEEEQKIKETEKQNLEHKLKDQKLENDKIRLKSEFTIATAIIAFLILIIVVVFYYLHRIRQKNIKLKSQHYLINSQKLMLEENIHKLTLSENELKKLNKTKDKLFSIIAHDLRSPFNSILGFSDLLIKNVEEFDVEETKEYLGIINSSTQNTLVLLENLLNWAKSQNGQITFNPQNITLSSILHEIIKLSNSAAVVKKISLIQNELEDIKVYADEDMLKTVLRNIISNAIKFTNSGGNISISAKKEQNQVEIAISDDGVGMNEETINKLFRIETNETTIGTANEKGSGLGLILCKELVEKQGGKIWVESELGKGSIFKFMLPLNK
ncbi:ATP-binding protein [Ancylomarina sp. 16SWW S1-10-2]|uniref:tetratricopeptide repeat-containing sensor histidine kinase n=1 Tax=Ancylomarina sp. 16SWW S1-10-2 TaxID=2499681 RepID=UPI00189FCE9A|nr:ATP-binding protein [Ancylomarina sp. 16SWW S1-10-2]